MADISKCLGTDCPMKHSCYRFTAPNSEYLQAWMRVPLTWITSGQRTIPQCKEYWDNKEYTK